MSNCNRSGSAMYVNQHNVFQNKSSPSLLSAIFGGKVVPYSGELAVFASETPSVIRPCLTFSSLCSSPMFLTTIFVFSLSFFSFLLGFRLVVCAKC